jgi:hypothetical protein
VSGIYVTQGFSGGLDASALLSELSVNGTVFDFGAPVAGPPGPVGEGGTSTTTVLTTTVFVQEPAAVVKPVNLIGDDLRVIHVPRRHHERFLSARATLRGKRLPVHGRAIQVDLRNQPAGNYNVHIRARYRRANGTVHTVRTTRNLSVTQA